MGKDTWQRRAEGSGGKIWAVNTLKVEMRKLYLAVRFVNHWRGLLMAVVA